MAQYNFLDPSQEQAYLQKAQGAGLSLGEAQAYVNNKKREQLKSAQIGLDLGKQQVDTLKLNKEMAGLLSGKEELTAEAKGKQRFASLSRNTLNQMKSIYGMGDASNVGTDNDLSEGEGILGKLGRSTEDLVAGVTGKSNKKRDSAKEFNDLAQMLVGQLSQAFGSGTPQEGEAKRLISSMPTRGSNDATAKAWFENVDRLLAQSAGEEVVQPGLNIGQSPQQSGTQIDAPQGTQPALNIKGEVAKYGDIILNPQKGQLEIYGKENTEDTVFKKTAEGSEIDNSLLKFLADTEVLPIAGSIIGGLMGGGLGSIATGAAGATLGKTMQQGLRELLDPDRQDMSDMAKAVVIEGMTDAVLGGATFGIGKAVSKVGGKLAEKAGIKIMFGNMGEQALKAGGESLEEGVQSGLKMVDDVSNAQRGLIRKGLNITKNEVTKQPGDILGEIAQKGYKSLEDAAEKSAVQNDAAIKKLYSILEGKSVKTGEVVSLLENAKLGLPSSTKLFAGTDSVVSPAVESGVKEIDKWINYVKASGDEISGVRLNEVKQGLQEAFEGSTETVKGSKKIVQDASTAVKNFIEGLGDEGVIRNTNREIFITNFVQNHAEKAIKDNAKMKSIFNFSDLVFGVTNPQLLVSKKAIDLFSGQFDDITKAAMLKDGLQMAAAQGNRNAVRNILRFANRLGVGFGAAHVSEALSQPDSVPQPPGLGLEAQTTGMEMGAFSPEGAPLYR